MEEKQEEYEAMVQQITPKANGLLQFLKAFVVGGGICLLGQWEKRLVMDGTNMQEKDALMVVTLTFVFISVLLTGWNQYGKITTFAGAGGLVPITGFANSVAAPAIEYQKEGQVFGIGVQIFSIAGPVILYGIFSSFVVGLLYLVIIR